MGYAKEMDVYINRISGWIWIVVLVTSSVGGLSYSTLAQEISSYRSHNSQFEINQLGIRLTVTPSVATGIVTGDIEAESLIRSVRSGMAISGMVKVLLQHKDTQRAFGLGMLVGITATAGHREVYKERVWIFRYVWQTLENRRIQQTAFFLGPMVQIGWLNGLIKTQFGVAWNRSNWATNMFTSEDWYSSGDAEFRDDRIGAGAFLFLVHKRFSLGLMYHELEARVVHHYDHRPDISDGVTAMTTWLTLGVSF